MYMIRDWDKERYDDVVAQLNINSTTLPSSKNITCLISFLKARPLIKMRKYNLQSLKSCLCFLIFFSSMKLPPALRNVTET